jgi:hypothetical protein
MIGGAQSGTHRRTVIATLAVCALILFIRKRDAFLNPQFFAEDGAVYFAQARAHGVRSMFLPYRGTWWLYPRLVAELGNALPVGWLPAWYNAGALLIILATIAYLLTAPTGLWWKPLLAMAVVACPTDGSVLLCLVNSHWIFSLAIPILLVSEEPETLARVLLETAVLIMIGLTGPIILMALPLFFLRAVHRRTSYSWALLGLAALCSLVQGLWIDSSRRAGSFNPFDPNWVGWLGNAFSGVLFLSTRFLSTIPNNGYLALLTVFVFLFLAADVVVHRDWTRFTFLALALAIFAATGWAFKGDPRPLSRWLGARYSYIPTVLVIWSLVLTMRSGKRAGLAATVLSILVMAASLSNFRFRPMENYHWQGACRLLDGNQDGTIPINPPGWQIAYHHRK